MSNPGKSKGFRGGSKRDSRMNTNFDASELIGFRYDRAPSSSPPQRNGRKHVHRPTLPPVSKAQFVQANFRFLLGPLTNPLEACLYDPDVIVPWKFVQCVILPQKVQVASNTLRTRSGSDEPVLDAATAISGITAADYATGEDDLYSQTCPICLDNVQIPRLTSCGHTFCYTCILRHLNSDLANYNKCPICAVSLVAADLKTVFYSHEDAAAVFSQHPGQGEMLQHEGRRRIAPGVTELQVGQACTFQLLELTKGSIVPRLCKPTVSGGIASMEVGSANHVSSHTKNTGGLTLNQVLPECAADGAHYSRLTCLSVDMMRQLFTHDRCTLQNYRQQCLPPVTGVGVNPCAVPTERVSVSAPSSAWGAPPSASKATPIAAQGGAAQGHGQAPAAGSAAKVAWGDKRLTAGIVSGAGGSGGGSGGGAGQEPSAAVSAGDGTGASTGYGSVYDVELAGDVEALPFITQALERQQALESAFESTVTFDPPVPIVRQSSNPSAGSGTSGAGHGAGKASYRIFQHVSGNLIFLHPICAKCILESQHSTAIALPGRQTSLPASTGSSETTDIPAVSDTVSTAANTSAGGNSGSSGGADQHALVTGTIIEIERVRVTEDSRTRYNVLRHLPLHSEALLVEIDVAPLVPPHVLCKYSDELGKRALRRKERAKQEKRERRLEHDKAVAAALLAQERHDYQRKLRDMELAQLEDLMRGPALSVQSGHSGGHGEGYGGGYGGDSAGSESDYSGIGTSGLGQGQAHGQGSRGEGGTSRETTFSFSTITQMGGNFPTLSAATSSHNSGNAKKNSGAWGVSKATPSKSAPAPPSGPGGDATARWAGTKSADTSASATTTLESKGDPQYGSAGGPVMPDPAATGVTTTGAGGSKKFKKGKIVLMSNAGLRGAR